LFEEAGEPSKKNHLIKEVYTRKKKKSKEKEMVIGQLKETYEVSKHDLQQSVDNYELNFFLSQTLVKQSNKT
jgi:predicted transcriptional regulator